MTGTAAGRNFGGTRQGSNLCSTSVLAIDGDTGKVLWSAELPGQGGAVIPGQSGIEVRPVR